MFGSQLCSFNEDVLSAKAEDDESVSRLVEELKSRGRELVRVGNFKEGVRLYSKAIEVLTSSASSVSEEKAIVFGNRSMCYLNMGEVGLSLEDANKSLEFNSNYVKAYYRKAMAQSRMKDFIGAKATLSKGLLLKSDDKELQQQLTIVQQQLTSSSSSTTSSKPLKPSTTTTTTTAPSSSSRTSKSQPTSAKDDNNTNNNNNNDDDDDEDNDNKNLRGYKTTKSGTITTFFNNELDEETKKLIGDIAPKKIDVPTATTTTTTTTGSVWNSAGTYEEKILTPFAHSLLLSLFESVRVSCCCSEDREKEVVVVVRYNNNNNKEGDNNNNNNAVVITGDAQVTMIRGKRKHLCDLVVVVDWQLLLLSSTGEEEKKISYGKITIDDITADGDYEIGSVVVLETDKSCEVDVKKYVDDLVKKGDKSFVKKEIKEIVKKFCELLKEK